VLAGLAEGFAGWRKATRPSGWPGFAAAIDAGSSEPMKSRARELSVLFGDGRALAEVKRLALDGKADMTARRSALQAVIDSRSPDAREICERLLNVRFLNTTAVRGLAAFDDPELGDSLARSYRSFHPSERPALLETLAARPVFAAALLREMAAGRIPREDLSPYFARQIRSFNREELTRQLAKAWGDLRQTEPDKRAQIASRKAKLSPAVLARADRSAGRVVYNTVCAACHRLYGVGGDAGPDLTGAGRDNLDYLLENIVAPSAVVSADFKVSVVTLKDGRGFNGVLMAQNERSLTLKLMNGPVALDKAEIEETRLSELSLMPDGLLDGLSEEQVRDLIGYLMSPSQVPLRD
jgi:putative heme-binding domain-containing protein